MNNRDKKFTYVCADPTEGWLKVGASDNPQRRATEHARDSRTCGRVFLVGQFDAQTISEIWLRRKLIVNPEGGEWRRLFDDNGDQVTVTIGLFDLLQMLSENHLSNEEQTIHFRSTRVETEFNETANAA